MVNCNEITKDATERIRISAQFFDFFTKGKKFITGGGGGGGSNQKMDRTFGGLGGLGFGSPSSGYGVPQGPVLGGKPSYGPTPRPQRPSYGASKPSYGGKGFELPNINIPNPIDFKAGVLRSKGRIASGLLHAKAGILRAGANILAQKANALDKAAQAIPSVNANLINALSGFGKGGGGGYGAPSGGYGAPTPPTPSYGAPAPQQPSGYGVPQPPTPRPSYGARPSNNYGAPQGPVITGNTINNLSPLNSNQQQSNYGNTGNSLLANTFVPSSQLQPQTLGNSNNYGAGTSSLSTNNNFGASNALNTNYGTNTGLNSNQFFTNNNNLNDGNQIITSNNIQSFNQAQSAPNSYQVGTVLNTGLSNVGTPASNTGTGTSITDFGRGVDSGLTTNSALTLNSNPFLSNTLTSGVEQFQPQESQVIITSFSRFVSHFNFLF